ncbi:amidohydrolase [Methylobacterium sp. ARG-1]|uniref:amidohydrolase n=1 Tax=Methylobacterium sp. ARG-1 TaxID=1692501 RepID=UPI00067FAE3A|nr:amidohydrolase [Methylobacterium sp. ARG-1]KNY24304.1 amidohydrolase [Methylobacterium sp. ARG-1]
MPSEITLFEARRVITMNPSRPDATHIAVQDGRVLMVGTQAEFDGLDAVPDRRFADKVILPGFVEGHAHVMEGTLWRQTYVGASDRRSPDGRRVPGLHDIGSVVDRLSEADRSIADPDQLLYGWGFDPLHLGGARLTRHDLDRVSTTRPVMVHHASLHITNVNSLLLEMAGFDETTAIDGVPKLPDGTPSGELQGIAARLRLFRGLGYNPMSGTLDAADVARFGAAAQLQGITTIADLHNDLTDATVAVYGAACVEGLPVRIVPALASVSCPPEDGVAKIGRLVAANTDRLRFGIVKIVVDGSIQGFTARLLPPGYHNGAPNGLWYVAPEDLDRIVGIYHAAGIQLHIHTNGNEATEAALDAVEKAQIAHPRPDHRHTLQHCQMATEAQLRRVKALGLCLNLFSNHLYYWGDAHHDLTMGPERAARIDAAGSAARLGIPLAIHSDAPVTPLGPLFTAWCAVNRTTSSGRLLGPEERLSVAEALHAVTLGAAYTLRMDHCVGSIEAGKFADFAVLDADPYEVPPETLKDVPVHATVLGGRVFAVPPA